MDPHNAIVRILNDDGSTEGTGFIAGPERLIVTCAHVVEGGRGPGAVVQGNTVRLHFHSFERAFRLGDKSSRTQEGCREFTAWIEQISASDCLDIALLRLGATPAQMEGLFAEDREPRLETVSIGSSYGAEGRDFSTFGFSYVKQLEGTPGECHITGPTTEGTAHVLALNSKDVSRGFSGAPVWDRSRLAIIGMVVSIIGMSADPSGGPPRPLDPFGKQIETGYLIPSETLLQFYPSLRNAGECPYREFERFEEEQADDFFGRDTAIRTLITHLRDQHFCIISGVSGSGKSSLVRAGIARGLRDFTEPALLERERVVVIPGANPVADLLKTLRSFTGPEFDDTLLAVPTAENNANIETFPSETNTAQALVSCLQTRGVKLLLIVDQFERIYTDCRDKTLSDAFVRLLDVLAGSQIKVLVALRADFLGVVSSGEILTRRMNSCLMTLLPMLTPDDLKNAIVKPAERRGCRIEDKLLDRLIQDVAGRAGNLPLLQFGLTRLWEKDAAHGTLTLESYDALIYRDPETDTRITGVRGIVVRRAEEIWGDLDILQQAAAERIFLALYNTDLPTAATPISLAQAVALPFSSRRAHMEEFDPLAQEVARILSQSFLLTLGNDDSNTNSITIEVSHEALLWNWPRILHLTQQYAALIRWRNLELAPFLRRWVALNETERQNPNAEYLLPRSLQEKAQEFLELFPDKLLGPPSQLIQKSLDQTAQEAEQKRQNELLEEARQTAEANARRNLRRRLFVGGSVTMAVTLAALVGYVVMRIQSRRITARDLLQQAVAANSDKDFGTAEELAARSLSFEDKLEARSLLLEASARGPRALLQFNAAGRVLAINDQGTLVASVENVKYQRQNSTGHSETYTLAQTIHIFNLRRGTEEVLPTLPGDEEARSAAFSTNGEILWYGSSQGILRVWDISNDKLADVPLPSVLPSENLKGKTAAISSIVCNPTLNEVAYGTEAGQTVVWHPQQKKQEILPELSKAPIWTLSYSSDGRELASGDGSNLLRCWSVTTLSNSAVPAKWMRTFTTAAHSDVVQSVTFSPSGKQIATASADGTIRLWNAHTGAMQHTLLGHLGAVTCILFSRDGKRLISGGEDGTVRLWLAENGQSLTRIPTNNRDVVMRISVSGTKSILVGGMNGGVEKWSLENNEEGYSLHNLNGTMAAVDFAPDGLLIAAAGDDYIGAKANHHSSSIHLYQSDTGLIAGPDLEGHKNAINCVTFSPDGSLMASGDKGGDLLVWRRVSSVGQSESHWEQIKGKVNHPGEVTTIVFLSPTIIASGYRAPDGKSGQILVTDLTTMQATPFPHDGGSVFSLATNPGSGILVSAGGDGSVRIWKYPKASILSNSPDQKIKIEEDRHLRQKLGDSDWAVAVSPVGTLYAVGSTNQTIRIADYTGTQTSRDLRAQQSGVYSLSFSEKGRWLASGYSDSKVVLWRATTHGSSITPDDYAVAAILHWHNQPISWVAFSHDGHLLATAGLDGDLRVWNMEKIDHDLTDSPKTLFTQAQAHRGMGVKVLEFSRREAK